MFNKNKILSDIHLFKYQIYVTVVKKKIFFSFVVLWEVFFYFSEIIYEEPMKF